MQNAKYSASFAGSTLLEHTLTYRVIIGPGHYRHPSLIQLC